MNLPADKVVIQNVPVLAARFQQVPNPAFTGSGAGVGFGQSQPSEGASQPAYIQGDIQTVTVLVPRASVELVTFGIDNGRVHLVLLPAKTAEEAKGAQSPTFGITFNDVLAWMMRERSQVASGQPQLSAAPPTQPAPVQSQPTVNANPGSGQPTSPGNPPAGNTQPTRANPNQPRPTPTAAAPASIPTGLDVGAILVPLLCGVVFLVILVAVVRFIRKRRRDNGLV